MDNIQIYNYFVAFLFPTTWVETELGSTNLGLPLYAFFT